MMTVITPDWPAPNNIVAGTATKLVPEGMLPQELQFLHQVHGADVVPIAAVREASSPIEADAVFGNQSGDHCAIRTADCLPILFCSRDGSEIAAAHGGWRGVLAGVIENTLGALDADPGNVLVWLGPAISQKNFEVGDEVREAYSMVDPESARFFAPNDRGRWQADLYGLARLRLRKCGVEAIYGGTWCTYDDSERFYSYRRNRDSGRLVTFIHLK